MAVWLLSVARPVRLEIHVGGESEAFPGCWVCKFSSSGNKIDVGKGDFFRNLFSGIMWEKLRGRYMHRISAVKVLQGYSLELLFDDMVSGTVDLSDLAGNGVFARWLDRQAF